MSRPMIRAHLKASIGRRTSRGLRLAEDRQALQLTDYNRHFGTMPPQNEINEGLRRAWSGDSSFLDEATSDQEFQLGIIYQAADSYRLHIWDQVPQFVYTASSPNG